jgi:hypothetical protein
MKSTTMAVDPRTVLTREQIVWVTLLYHNITFVIRDIARLFIVGLVIAAIVMLIVL